MGCEVNKKVSQYQSFRNLTTRFLQIIRTQPNAEGRLGRDLGSTAEGRMRGCAC